MKTFLSLPIRWDFSELSFIYLVLIKPSDPRADTHGCTDTCGIITAGMSRRWHCRDQQGFGDTPGDCCASLEVAAQTDALSAPKQRLVAGQCCIKIPVQGVPPLDICGIGGCGRFVEGWVSSLRDGVGTLKDGVRSLEDGIGLLKDEVGLLKDGVGSLKTGSWKDGAGSLKDGAGLLRGWVGSLEDMSQWGAVGQVLSCGIGNVWPRHPAVLSTCCSL